MTMSRAGACMRQAPPRHSLRVSLKRCTIGAPALPKRQSIPPVRFQSPGEVVEEPAEPDAEDCYLVFTSIDNKSSDKYSILTVSVSPQFGR